MDEYGKYDPIPPKLEEYFEDFRMKTHMWNLFTFIPHYKHDIAMVYTNINNFFSGKIKDSSKDTQLPTSLLHYYYLLPRWARDHPTMKMIIRGLEYSQPFMSLREKIILVNIGLHIIMGKDDNFTEILTDINETRKENITMENIQELISYKDDERLNVQEATDYATDDEDELDNSYTEADYREEERLEEKLRKEQKKEEGRKKRAEAEAKELAASGKIDKEAEEKKKKEEAEKKKKAAAAAANEIAEEPEEEEETSQDSEKTEEKQAKESENLSPFKHRNKHKRSRVDAEEKVIDIYEQVNDLKNQTDDFVVDQPVVSKSAAEDLDFEDEGEDAGETSEVKDEETDTVTQEKEVSRFENDSELQKSKVANLLIELKNVNNPKYIEGRLVNIRKELQIRMQEKFSYHLTKAGLISSEEIDKFKLEDSLNDSSIIPVSLYLSPILKEMHKEIIKNVFRITKEDIERYSPYAIILEEEYLIQQEKAKIIFSLAVTDKREIDPDEVDYKDSYNSKLSEDVVEVGDDEDEMGMKDVYYKPPRDYTIRLRTFDPVSFDYYINEDGFWNTYIDEKKKLANVKDFIYKPFIERKNMIQRKKQTDEF